MIEMIKIGYQVLIDPVLNNKDANKSLVTILKDNLEIDE